MACTLFRLQQLATMPSCDKLMQWTRSIDQGAINTPPEGKQCRHAHTAKLSHPLSHFYLQLHNRHGKSKRVDLTPSSAPC